VRNEVQHGRVRHIEVRNEVQHGRVRHIEVRNEVQHGRVRHIEVRNGSQDELERLMEPCQELVAKGALVEDFRLVAIFRIHPHQMLSQPLQNT